MVFVKLLKIASFSVELLPVGVELVVEPRGTAYPRELGIVDAQIPWALEAGGERL